MSKKYLTNSGFVSLLLFLLILSLFSGSKFVGLVTANFFPIPIPQPAFTIRSDGSIDPPTASIHRDGNVYTLTDNIVNYTIAAERDNIVIDGGGYALQGNGNSTGIFLKNRNGITVRNMKISGFEYGIRLFAEDFMSMTSVNNILADNLFTDNKYGIYISYSVNNTLRRNQMTNNVNNFWIYGGFISESQNGYINDVDSSNTVDGKPIIYWVNQGDKTVPSDAGYVALISCTNITVQNHNLANNGQGILLVYTTNSLVTKNHVKKCGSGIYIYNSKKLMITENNLAENSNGIKSYFSSDNSISSNTITNNEIGIYCTGTSENNILSGNNITANTKDGIHLWDSRNTTVENNNIANNIETGVNFFDCRNNKILKNTIIGNNGYGIKFWYHSNENSISENHIANNNCGILIDGSFDNKIIGNLITENHDWGIRLEGDQNNNVIYHNTFVDNNANGEGLQVSIPGYMGFGDPFVWLPGHGNVWDNGTFGNYWSDYFVRYPNATQIDGLGIGDTPFYINENNIDRFPVIEPTIISEFSSLTVLLVISFFVAIIVIYNQILDNGIERK